jgi:Ca2+/Na+ antiporter
VRAKAVSGLGVALAFVGSLLLGVALSVAFTTGHASLSSYLFLAAFACGIPLRTYRLEYVFGFVVGMAFAFGAVLPTLAASVAALTSLAFHQLVRPAVDWLVSRARA